MSTMHGDDYIVKFDDGLGLRSPRPEDFKALSFHASNKKIWDNLRDRMPHPYSEDDARKWIEICRDPKNFVRSGKWTLETGSQGKAIPTHYAIVVQDELVGFIGIDFGTDVYFRTAEIGYWLGEAHWGSGIMSKVAPAFVRWVWDNFDILVRLNAEAMEPNRRSATVLKKCGFVYEGTRVNAVCKNGQVISNVIWGALRPE